MAAPPGAQVAPTPAVVNEESSSDITLSVIGPDRSGGPLRVEFHLPSDEAATLEVLDVTGRRHLAREVGSLGAGHHQMAFRDVLPAGIYLVRLAQGSRVQVRKAIVLR
jgi:hypothetical protein